MKEFKIKSKPTRMRMYKNYTKEVPDKLCQLRPNPKLQYSHITRIYYKMYRHWLWTDMPIPITILKNIFDLPERKITYQLNSYQYSHYSYIRYVWRKPQPPLSLNRIKTACAMFKNSLTAQPIKPISVLKYAKINNSYNTYVEEYEEDEEED